MIQLVKLNIKCLLSGSYTSTCYLLLDTALLLSYTCGR